MLNPAALPNQIDRRSLCTSQAFCRHCGDEASSGFMFQRCSFQYHLLGMPDRLEGLEIILSGPPIEKRLLLQHL